MALIKCPDCGREISEKAFKCLYCGCTIESNLDDRVEEVGVQESLSASENTVTRFDYNKIGKMSIILGCLAWIIGFFQLFKDDLIVTMACFAGLVIVGSTLVIAGFLAILCGELKRRYEN
ncbi:hypothetical protein SDC9_136842 [bioreactor metagenome]|uniref:Zinc-ribbon domain-containing protein n=1 Tax=bioreactor metagenome TaxID=1076179 RepID=A0A645DJX0_9ZZZZ